MEGVQCQLSSRSLSENERNNGLGLDNLLTLMNNFQLTKCENKKLELLRNAAETIRFWNKELVHSQMETASLSDLFVEATQLCIPSEFADRGHYIFEQDDFCAVREKTQTVLGFLFSVFEMCNKSGVGPTHLRSVDKCLPDLLLVLTSNIRKTLWSSDGVQKLTLLVSDQLRFVYKVDSLSELLVLDVKTKDRDDAATLESSLLGQYLKKVKVGLHKDNWQANPTFVESFFWMLTRLMKFPFLNDHLDKVLPPALMFVDSHVTEHRVMGIKCLQHIAENGSRDQLRWYGRADVMYAALKQQIYSREPEIIRVLHPALLAVLPIIDRNPAKPASPTDMKEMDAILSIIISCAVTENGLVLRRLYSQCLADLVDALELSVVRHLSKLLCLVSDYLEVFDGPTEESRLNALKILKSLLQNAWPRIPGHAEQILHSLLKLIQDIACDKSKTPEEVKNNLIEKSMVCLSMLQELCPDVEMCLNSVNGSKDLSDITSIIQSQLNT